MTAVGVGVCVLVPSLAGSLAVLVSVAASAGASVRERAAGYLLGTWLVLVVLAVLFTPVG